MSEIDGTCLSLHSGPSMDLACCHKGYDFLLVLGLVVFRCVNVSQLFIYSSSGRHRAVSRARLVQMDFNNAFPSSVHSQWA